MNQKLKNHYYSLINHKDYENLNQINHIFTTIDNLILNHDYTKAKALHLISTLEETEPILYTNIKDDILKEKIHD